jgi:hypothetical protein
MYRLVFDKTTRGRPERRNQDIVVFPCQVFGDSDQGSTVKGATGKMTFVQQDDNRPFE